MTGDELKATITERGLKHPADLFEEFDADAVAAYYDFLVRDNEPGGFFSKNDSERIFERHLFESLLFARYVAREYYVASGKIVSRETRILDVGTGPGLPGYLFACRKPAPQLTLLDSSRRRLGRLEEWLNMTAADGGDGSAYVNSKDVSFSYERSEEHQAPEGGYDLVVARALIPFPASVELLCRLPRRGGLIALWSSELDPRGPQLDDYLARLGYVSRETFEVPELTFLGHRRIMLLIREGETRKPYPRDWKQIKDSISQWTKRS